MAVIAVRVRPSSSSDGIGPYADGVLVLSVTRPPADGEATRAAHRLLAKALKMPPSQVRLIAGARGRLKRFDAPGLTDADLAERLSRYRPRAD
ncbi:MAG TPA: DUF167 domain-containing protein [Candidatus Limnocylindria bacterium]|nr:DUF167 domain-containing protein [Candidatus Limnocylindria bacterium]